MVNVSIFEWYSSSFVTQNDHQTRTLTHQNNPASLLIKSVFLDTFTQRILTTHSYIKRIICHSQIYLLQEFFSDSDHISSRIPSRTSSGIPPKIPSIIISNSQIHLLQEFFKNFDKNSLRVPSRCLLYYCGWEYQNQEPMKTMKINL